MVAADTRLIRTLALQGGGVSLDATVASRRGLRRSRCGGQLGLELPDAVPQIQVGPLLGAAIETLVPAALGVDARQAQPGAALARRGFSIALEQTLSTVHWRGAEGRCCSPWIWSAGNCCRRWMPWAAWSEGARCAQWGPWWWRIRETREPGGELAWRVPYMLQFVMRVLMGEMVGVTEVGETLKER